LYQSGLTGRREQEKNEVTLLRWVVWAKTKEGRWEGEKKEDKRIGLLLGFNKDVFVGRVQTEQRIG
jgi:hypothetical protein